MREDNNFISVEEAKEILWEDAKWMSDTQIQDLLDFLYSICAFIWNKQSKK